MLKKNIVDLLNQELDGTNGPKDSASVKRILERNAEARQYFADLQSVAEIFRKVPVEAPPARLKENILSAIRLPEAPAIAARTRKPLLDGFFSSTGFRYAYTFAGGAVAGILLFVLFTNAPTDSKQVVGAMAPHHPEAIAEATVELHLEHATGSLTVFQVEKSVTAELNLQTAEEIDVILNFNEHQLKFHSFRPEDNTRTTLTILDGQVRLTLSGQHSYNISFVNESNDMPSLTAKVYAQGVLLSSYDLSLERKINH